MYAFGEPLDLIGGHNGKVGDKDGKIIVNERRKALINELWNNFKW